MPYADKVGEFNYNEEIERAVDEYIETNDYKPISESIRATGIQ